MTTFRCNHTTMIMMMMEVSYPTFGFELNRSVNTSGPMALTAVLRRARQDLGQG